MISFQISGTVRQNTGRGKKLGFPTANIKAPPNARDGIYLGYTYVDGRRYPSLLFIGRAVTFGETKRFAESYVLDFEADLYGKSVEMEFVKFIRENRRFASEEELKKQISEDERIAREYFGLS